MVPVCLQESKGVGGMCGYSRGHGRAWKGLDLPRGIMWSFSLVAVEVPVFFRDGGPALLLGALIHKASSPASQGALHPRLSSGPAGARALIH